MAHTDPTAGFTDMQWYMYQQRNVAFFAAFTARSLSSDELLAAARGFTTLAPQLRTGFANGAPDRPLQDQILRALIYRESVETLEGFPERWLDRGDAVFADPALPLFRVRYAALASPDAQGRGGFLLVQASHALVEGADSALLSRSQSAAHPVTVRTANTAPLIDAAATGIGTVVAGLHLLAGNLVTPHPGPYAFATRAYPRSLFSRLSRELGVRQRALFFALVTHTLFGAGTPAGPGSLSATYSVIEDGGGAGRDSYMRMRMRFARFGNLPDFSAYVRALDAQLTAAEAKESGFGDAMNAKAIGLHRRLSRLLPFAYTPRLFQFMPFDVVIGLIPPHRLGGGLTAGLIEPVYAGAALEGVNACVIVPNRRQVTFNFYVQRPLLERIGALDEALSGLVISRSAAAS